MAVDIVYGQSVALLIFWGNPHACEVILLLCLFSADAIGPTGTVFCGGAGHGDDSGAE